MNVSDGRVHDLRSRLLHVLGEELPPTPDRWALMPAPLHGNVGDSAILLGTLDVLREIGWPDPTVISDMETFDADTVARRVGSGPIVFMGGGNFGDLYPKEHRVREEALSHLGQNPVLQLPQSIHFTSPAAVERTVRALSGRSEVPLLLRDQLSVDWARAHLVNTRPVLCPDMAFGLGPLRCPGPVQDVVRLLRQDHESSLERERLDPQRPSVDWLGDAPDRSIAAEATLRDLGRRRRGLRPLTNRLRERLHPGMAVARLRRGVEVLARGRVVITDRLHGHILCVLMGLPHAVLEDRNGKIAGFARQWTEDLPTVRLCTTRPEAEEAARELLAEFGR